MNHHILIVCLALVTGQAHAIEIEAPLAPIGLHSAAPVISPGLQSTPPAPAALQVAPTGPTPLIASPEVTEALHTAPSFTPLDVAREEEPLRVNPVPVPLRTRPDPTRANTDPSVAEIADALASDSIIRLMNIEFEYDSDILTAPARAEVAQLAEALRLSGEGTFVIVGNSDSQGPAAYNYDLSLRRATSVRNLLIDAHGFLPSQLRTEGRGEDNPIDFTGTPAGNQRNRRVEVTALSPPGS